MSTATTETTEREVTVDFVTLGKDFKSSLESPQVSGLAPGDPVTDALRLAIAEAWEALDGNAMRGPGLLRTTVRVSAYLSGGVLLLSIRPGGLMEKGES